MNTPIRIPRRITPGLLAMGLALGAGVIAAQPAASANCTGTAFAYTSTVAQVNSPKGCDNYAARARYTVSGSTAYSAFGTTHYESQYPGTNTVPTWSASYAGVPNASSPNAAQTRSYYGGGVYGYSSWMNT